MNTDLDFDPDPVFPRWSDPDPVQNAVDPDPPIMLAIRPPALPDPDDTPGLIPASFMLNSSAVEPFDLTGIPPVYLHTHTEHYHPTCWT